MRDSFLPRGDGEIIDWGRGYSGYVSANFASIGVAEPLAQNLGDAFVAFNSAYQAARNPMTRTAGHIAEKNRTREAFKQAARQVAGLVKAHETTDQQLLDMGLRPRSGVRTPRPIPAHAPGMALERVSGHTIHIRLRDVQNPDSRARPRGVAGCAIYYCVQEDVPSAAEWKLAMNATRTICSLTIPQDHSPGARVWLTARWFNHRMQAGPAAEPHFATLGGGTSLPKTA